VVKWPQRFLDRVIVATGFESKGTLSDGRQNGLQRQEVRDSIRKTEAAKSSFCKNYRIVLPIVQLPQSRVDIPANILHF
jgi:hypothetical protein